MTILLNEDIWLGTKMWNQSSTGRLNLELSGHSLNEGTCLVNRKMTQYNTGGLSLRLRAIIRENGGAWSVTKYLTWVKLCSLWLRHLVYYQDITISPRPGLGM